MAQSAEQRRVYTDDRLPNLEIHNFGSPVFVVFEKDPTTGRFNEVDQFVGYERPGADLVSEVFAQRRAKDYFERMTAGHMNMELAARDSEPQDVPIRQAAKRLKGPPNSAGNPLLGMSEMTPQDVDAMIATARAETDPEKRKALFKQAMSMAAQQESAAHRVVRMLLSL